MKMHPSFLRCASRVLVAMAIAVLLGTAVQSYSSQSGWHWRFETSLLIPVVLAPIVVWFAFVPTRFEFNEAVVDLKFFGRPAYVRSWQDLSNWGRGNNVFLLQFGNEQAFQVFAAAYSADQWAELTDFLTSRHANRRANFWIGPFGTRRRQ